MTNIQLVAELIARDKSFSRELGKAGRQVDTTGKKFSKFGKGAAAALAGIGVGAWAASSVKEFAAAEAQQAKLEGAYKRFPKIADTNIESFRDLNSALQAKTKFDDDDLAAMQAKLAMFDLTGSKIAELTPIVADYAQVSGQDVETAASSVGKALMGNTRALKTLGIDYKSTGDKATDLANIQELLKQKVAGAAEEYGKTTAGQLDILNNQYGELKETVGAGLTPALSNLVQIVTPLAQSFASLPEPVKTGAVAAAGAAVAFGYLSPALSATKSALSGMSGMFSKTAQAADGAGGAATKASGGMAKFGTAAAIGGTVTAMVQGLNAALESSDSQWARIGEQALNMISPLNAFEDAWRQLDLAMHPRSSGTTGGIDDPEVLKGVDASLSQLVRSGNISQLKTQWSGLMGTMDTALEKENFINSLPGLAAELRAAGISVDDLATSVNSLPDAKTVTVSAKENELVARVNAAQARLDALRQKRPTDVKAIDLASEKVRAAQTKLDSFRQGKVPNVTVDTTAASRKLADVIWQLAQIKDKNVNIVTTTWNQVKQAATGMRDSDGVWATVGERGPEKMWVPEGSSILTHSQSLNFAKGKKPKKPGKGKGKDKGAKEAAQAAAEAAAQAASDALQQAQQAADARASVVESVASGLRGWGSVAGFNTTDHADAMRDVDDADKAVRDARANIALAKSVRERRDAINSLRDAEAQQRQAQQKARDTEVTPANILKRMRERANKISRFRDVVYALSRMGLNRNSLKDIIAEGPDVGLAIGEALLQSGVADVNTQQAYIDYAAADIGNLSADLNGATTRSAPVVVQMNLDGDRIGQVTLAKHQRKNRRQGRRGLGVG